MSRIQRSRSGRRALIPVVALSLGVLGACENILSVDLPGQIEESTLFEPEQASILVSSAIANFECAYSDFVASDVSGNEDVFLRVTGWWGGSFEYRTSPNTVNCNTSDVSYGWWNFLQAGRFLAETTYDQLTQWSDQQVPNRNLLLAQTAIYAGASYDLLGEYFCEIAVEGGPLMSPDETLKVAEEWLTKALGHIGTTDFAIPGGVTSSARQTALLLRSRARWARGDDAGALADAQAINRGFKAFATREAGGERTRWNRIVNAHNGSGWGTVAGAIDWWEGPGTQPAFLGGGPWPSVIPFTGYRKLGVLPDGRAVTENGFPITTTGAATAVNDPRVPVVDSGRIFNAFPSWVQQKYRTLDDDIPFANWEEAWLIRAEIQGGQQAIDLVNEIRTVHNLPKVTYLSPSDDAGIKRMIIEERRRSLFLEGRFWSTKIQENLWFPRGTDTTPYPYPYLQAVRMTLPDAEYQLNQNFDESARGTLCAPSQQPEV